jgi:5-methylcytosine-specific restriction endonuclease McrA
MAKGVGGREAQAVSYYDSERYVRWRVRKAVLERDKARVYCGRPVARIKDDSEGGPNDQWRAYDGEGRPFHFDHQIPFSRGGASDESNIVLACADCNLRKAGHRFPREKGEQLALPMEVGDGRLYPMNMPQLF